MARPARFDATGGWTMNRGANHPCRWDGDGERTSSAAGGGAPRDLFFDFSRAASLDVASLGILFTARQVADRRHRKVWVAGLPAAFWSYVREMGLDEWFEEFPEEDRLDA